MPLNHCYLVKLNDGKEEEHVGAPCYASHYKKLDTVRGMELYIGHDQCSKIDRDEIIAYCRLLRRLGLKFRLKKDYQYKPKNKDTIYPCYRIEFNTQQNNDIACKIILNATRYAWECNGWKVVKNFLSFAKEKSDLCLFDRFILANYFGNYFEAHNMVRGDYVGKLLGEEGYKQWLSRTDHPNRIDDLFETANIDWYTANSTFKFEDTLEERYKKYLDLCEKKK